MKCLNRSTLTLSLMLASAPCAWAQTRGSMEEPRGAADAPAKSATRLASANGAAKNRTNTLPAVLVAATKQGASVFETPGSVSVIDGVAVEKQNLRGLEDVAQRVPNVYWTDFTNSAPSITIRGLGFSDDESDSTSSSVLMDGVPIHGQTLGNLFDLAQIEVLRGPQSTLYGQNSMGGLVAMRSRDPGSVFGGKAQVDYGTGNRRRLSLATDFPLSRDAALRIAVGGEGADGYVKNTALKRSDTTDWKNQFARLKFLHRDEAGGELRLGLHHVERKGGNDFFAPIELARQHRSNASDAGIHNTEYTLLTGEYNRRFLNSTKLAVVLGGSTARWSYWTPASLFGMSSGFDAKTRQFSAEARLFSEPAPGGGFDWMVGAYASELRKETPYLFELPGYMRSATQACIHGGTAAIFGEVGWRFAPQWRLNGALRYERNRRQMDWRSAQRGHYDSNGDGVPDTPYSSTEKLPEVQAPDNVWLPQLTVEYRPTARQFAWGRLARGYKASGFNQFATGLVSAAAPYAPEYADYAEIGYRLSAADKAWELSAVGFYTNLRDQQVVVTGSGGQSLVANAGRSHNQGVELSATVRPVRGLEISGFAGYVKAVYDEYVKGGVDYAGQQFPNTPRHSFGVAMRWQAAPNWDAGLSVRQIGRSNLYPASTLQNPAYTLVDADVSYRMRRWTLGLYGKNLGNTSYFTRALNTGQVVAAPPRTLGVRASFDF